MKNLYEDCVLYNEAAICEHVSRHISQGITPYTIVKPMHQITMCDHHVCFWGGEGADANRIFCNGVVFLIWHFFPWDTFFTAAADNVDMTPSYNIWNKVGHEGALDGINMRVHSYVRRFQMFHDDIQNVTCDEFHTFVDLNDGTRITYGLDHKILTSDESSGFAFLMAWYAGFLLDTIIIFNDVSIFLHVLPASMVVVGIYAFMTDYQEFIVHHKEVFLGGTSGYAIGVVMIRVIIFLIVCLVQNIRRAHREASKSEAQVWTCGDTDDECESEDESDCISENDEQENEQPSPALPPAPPPSPTPSPKPTENTTPHEQTPLVNPLQ